MKIKSKSQIIDLFYVAKLKISKPMSYAKKKCNNKKQYLRFNLCFIC